MPLTLRAAHVAAVTVALAAPLCLAAPAGADIPTPPPGGGTSGGSNGSSISSAVTFDTSKNGTGTNLGTPTGSGSWTPPDCWYEPKYDPAALKAYLEGIWYSGSPSNDWVNTQKDIYVNGHPYTDFNLAKTGQGMWWSGVLNPSGNAANFTCTAPEFWVDNGQPSPVVNSVTSKDLAAAAYGKVQIPGTTFALSPGLDKQVVNLPTWIWTESTEIHPVSVTAKLTSLGLWATTTATPVSLHLDPGSPDAETFPASGECPIDADGHAGTKYAGGTGNPPCGVLYHHSTPGGGTFPLVATITWKISWVGSDGAGGDLTSANRPDTTAVTVKEIQTVVTG